MNLIELQSSRVLCSDCFLKNILSSEKLWIPMQISPTSGKFKVCLNSFDILASKFVQLFMGSIVIMASKDLPIMLQCVEGFRELAGTHGNLAIASCQLNINSFCFRKWWIGTMLPIPFFATACIICAKRRYIAVVFLVLAQISSRITVQCGKRSIHSNREENLFRNYYVITF